MLDPVSLTLIGVALSVGLSAVGSAVGTYFVGSASTSLLAKEPEKFGQALVLSALPSSQSVYGLLFGFILLIKIGLLGGDVATGLTTDIGFQLMLSSLPVAISCIISGICQGLVASTGVKILADKPENLSQALVMSALVESFAIFGLVISLLIAFVGIQIPV
jgi:V/A-type H+-transporting ATPase subunit K